MDIELSDLDRARQGDAHAFMRLIQPHDKELRSFTYRLLADRHAMDDVLQEVYIKAFRSLKGFRGDASLRTWLFRIARNTSIDAIRSRRSHRTLDFDVRDLGQMESAAVSRLDLGRALAQLGHDHRQVVLLIDGAGFDYAEAAAVIGVSVGTVRSRLSRARSQLRQKLEGGEDV